MSEQKHAEAAGSPTTDEAAPPPAKVIRRQRLGMRLGLEPYYTITEHTPTRLVLESTPGANARAGRPSMILGGVCIALTPISMLILAIGGINPFFSALLAWPFIAIGFIILNSGRAIATTTNQIVIDRDAETMVYRQQNNVNRLRSQTLRFAQVEYLRLRPRPLRVQSLPRREEQIVALEMVTNEAHTWIIDSAADGTALAPTGEVVAEFLSVSLYDRRASPDV